MDRPPPPYPGLTEERVQALTGTYDAASVFFHPENVSSGIGVCFSNDEGRNYIPLARTDGAGMGPGGVPEGGGGVPRGRRAGPACGSGTVVPRRWRNGWLSSRLRGCAGGDCRGGRTCGPFEGGGGVLRAWMGGGGVVHALRVGVKGAGSDVVRGGEAANDAPVTMSPFCKGPTRWQHDRGGGGQGMWAAVSGGGGGWHEALVLVGLPLAVPIGLSPLHTFRPSVGPDVCWFGAPGQLVLFDYSGGPRDGLLPVPSTRCILSPCGICRLQH